MVLLIFFALPLATILLAIVLEKILKSPILVAITFFSVYLIVLFALFATSVIANLAVGLIAIIIYTIIAFITAYFVQLIRTIKERFFDEDNDDNCYSNNLIETNDNSSCDCNNNINNGIALNGNITPNQYNGGRTGMIRGCYRRF